MPLRGLKRALPGGKDPLPRPGGLGRRRLPALHFPLHIRSVCAMLSTDMYVQLAGGRPASEQALKEE